MPNELRSFAVLLLSPLLFSSCYCSTSCFQQQISLLLCCFIAGKFPTYSPHNVLRTLTNQWVITPKSSYICMCLSVFCAFYICVLCDEKGNNNLSSIVNSHGIHYKIRLILITVNVQSNYLHQYIAKIEKNVIQKNIIHSHKIRASIQNILKFLRNYFSQVHTMIK